MGRTPERPLIEQLDEYARRIVSDRNSLNMLEVFVGQMEELFASLASLLDRESKPLTQGRESIGWSVMRKEHEEIADRIESELSEFIKFLKTILRSAREDERFLKRYRDSIADLFSEGELRLEFIRSAQRSIEDEEQYLESLEFLDDLYDRSIKLIKDLRSLATAYENDSDHDKTLALVESCRMRAVKIHEQCARIGAKVPGLREVDAQQARKLGMLARTMKSMPI